MDGQARLAVCPRRVPAAPGPLHSRGGRFVASPDSWERVKAMVRGLADGVQGFG